MVLAPTGDMTMLDFELYWFFIWRILELDQKKMEVYTVVIDFVFFHHKKEIRMDKVTIYHNQN